ncbi:hypothetical protein VE00_01254 [Pseudogymnoascus sp. WSF 3629]|nr:hypothetical protein VE00_01254 [Pseudogymnoascus sp. WSF 3629]
MKGLYSAVVAGVLASCVHGLDPTDSIMDGDAAQSGYLPNHNMDPSIIMGGVFGQIWKFTTPAGTSEQFYAKPLVYTPSSTGKQRVLAFSEQNNVYALDAVNGTLLASRALETPFHVSDIGCSDISGTIGITGTPVIDPATDTLYLYAKSYLGNTTGWQNGAYRFHALDTVTLNERPGFPINIQGIPADNDPTRRFTGGTNLQRPSLNLIHGVIYAGFGGHCWIVGIDTAGTVRTAFVTEGGLHANPEDGTWTGGGGKAGIWMSGMGLASDNPSRLFFVTGNGQGHQNQNSPASGHTPLDTLDEAVVNLSIDPVTGKVSLQDYFEPYEYLAMDAADRDLGSGGICLLNSTTFNGNGVARMAVAAGKNGKAYIMNADNLGGYKSGPAGSDNVLQVLTMPGGGSIFGGAGSYPLEGGYLYMTPVGYPTLVFKFGHDSSGNPSFTQVAQTNGSSAGRVGVGASTITTLGGQPGTGILWVTDVDAGVRAYQAVPVNGQMIKINLPTAPFVNKFQRPAFGNGRYYVSTSVGNILGFGSPVALPLSCNTPLDFGSVIIGSFSTQNVTCTTNIALNGLIGLALGTAQYQASNSSLPTGYLAAGVSFTFPVIFNLTTFVLSPGSQSAPVVQPGTLTTSINILTNNAVAGYSISQPVVLTGVSVSSTPFLQTNPLELDFGGIVLGSVTAQTGLTGTFLIVNSGLSPMTITGYGYTQDDILKAPNFTNVTQSGSTGLYDLGLAFNFTSSNLPLVGTVLAPYASITVSVNFSPGQLGDYYSTLEVWSNGGSAYSTFTGTASTNPIGVLEVSNGEGGWLKQTVVNFGSQPALSQTTRQIRISNVGGSTLIITKSKPPGGPQLIATNPGVDLSESMVIEPNSFALGTVLFSPSPLHLNSSPFSINATWTLNTNDPNFEGPIAVLFQGSTSAKQVGPVNPDGSARYQYLGCYSESTGPRLLPKGYGNGPSNSNGVCQTQCLAYGSVFAGTEYQTECWCGNAIPPPTALAILDDKCSYTCANATDEVCGGNGGYISIYYDTERYFPLNGTITGIPVAKLSIGAYTYVGCYTDSTASRGLTGLELCGSGSRLQMYALNASNLVTSSSNSVVSTSTSSTVSSLTTKCSQLYVSIVNINSVTGFDSLYDLNIILDIIIYGGCWTDAVAARVLIDKKLYASTMTLENCATFCAGETFWGVEYGQECYCGMVLQATSVNATNQADCNMLCPGNPQEYCGAGSRLELYSLMPSVVPTSSSLIVVQTSSSLSTSSLSSALDSSPIVASTISSTLSSSSSSSASDSSPIVTSTTFSTLSSSSSVSINVTSTSSLVPLSTPSVGAISNGWQYGGCFNDSVNARALTSKFVVQSAATIESCQALCLKNSLPLAGLEHGTQCLCGSMISNYAVSGQSGCNNICSGNASEICGGTSRISIYNYTSFVPPVLAANIGNYVLQGCYTDSVANRTLKGYVFTNTTSMTQELCINTCKAKAYAYAGIEYGSQCYCGLAIGASATGVALAQCEVMTCAGTNIEWCGAASRIAVYQSS